MKKLLKSILIIFLLGMSLVANSQDSVSISEDFIETIAPKVESDGWFSLNHSLNEFGVKVVDGELIIEKIHKEEDICELKLQNGELVSFNRGEFGGQLFFISNDSTIKSVEIKKGNIEFIFEYNNKIYFIEGLAHISYSGGALFELDTVDQKFTYKKVLDFEAAPEAYAIYKGKLLIATHNGFCVVENLKKEIIFKNTFWSSLYPSSVAVLDEENVFVGIRGGIVKLDLRNRTMTFYQNEK